MTRATVRYPETSRRKRTMPSADFALDAVRTASMADEGGCSGATMDLREQLADAAPFSPARNARLLQRHALWGAVGAVAGLATGLLLARVRSVSR